MSNRLVPERRSRLPWREVGDRAVIIHPLRGEVHELNSTGSFLWSKTDGSRSLGELAALLTEQFEIAADAAGNDVTEFFDTLDAAELILWKDSPDNGTAAG